ncbi:MAG: hypothetical protein KDA96_06580 [Planctomycetaceae bacterium]|nr:hypothetical protein [Planctomycetaceae bacterium]
MMDRYFVTQLSSYFEWSDDGRELCWRNGATIAFHAEILSLLQRLTAEECLPDISTVALAMATMRGNWQETSAALTRAVQCSLNLPAGAIQHIVDGRRELLQSWTETASRLELLHQLSHKESLTLDQKSELLTIILRKLNTTFTPQFQTEVVERLQAGTHFNVFHAPDQHISVAMLLPEGDSRAFEGNHDSAERGQALLCLTRLLRIARGVAAAIPAHSVTELMCLLQSGVPDLPSPAEGVLIDQRSRMRTLLKEIADDPELAVLSKTTQQLIAALTLPREVSAADDLNVGGVSDIANRGSLDKLLLSELAQDDLVLSVRLALNEALYLRRESTPSHSSRTRTILIDSSLPMWGVPRIYAAAAALALHATTDRHTQIACLNSVKGQNGPLDLLSRDGLLSHMSSIDLAAHPGESLETFFKSVESDDQSVEPVMITTSDVLDHPDFQQRLADRWSQRLWLIVVERDGRVSILQKSVQGTSKYRSVRLNLNDLQGAEAAESLKDESVVDEPPAIMGQQLFPLLLPHQFRSNRVWLWNDRVVSMTDDGRLLYWHARRSGAQQLLQGLAVSKEDSVWWVESTPSRIVLLVARDHPPHLLITVKGSGAATGHNPAGAVVQVRVRSVDFILAKVCAVVPGTEVILICGEDMTGNPLFLAVDYEDGTAHECLGPTGLRRSLRQEIRRVVRNLVQTEDGVFHIVNWEGGQTQFTVQQLPPSLLGVDSVMPYTALLQSDGATTNLTISMGQDDTGTVNSGKSVDSRIYRRSWLLISPAGELLDIDGLSDFSRINGELMRRGIRLDQIVEISADGQFVVVTRQGGGQSVISLTQQKIRPEPDLITTISQEAVSRVTVRTPHFRFGMVAATDSGLLLRDHADGRSQLQLRDGIVRLAAVPKAEYRDHSWISFKSVTVPACPSMEMYRAEFPDSSTAWIDGRGLLYLKSSEHSIPEVTLVLRDGQVSGWLATGSVFGDRYYIEHPQLMNRLTTIPPGHAWQLAVQPFLNRVS